MLDNELAYRAAVGALGIMGFAVRTYYQWLFRDVQRTADKGAGRAKIFYWLAFSAFVLAFFYAFQPSSTSHMYRCPRRCGGSGC